MKTTVAGLVVAFLCMTTFCMAQKDITVSAQNSDISNNLDLKAVATAFGESKDLQEFEQKLNDYDSQISNLDLNKDGQVDYLRVIEKTDKGVHVVVIQAVLDKDVYQDVASIIVEKDQNDNPTVQVVGDPYIYGDNYIIEPAYLYTPSIFSFFWGANYYMWNSPYYWGYYPTYYHRHNPYETSLYMSNVYSRVNHNQRYYYTNNIRNTSAASMIRSSRRNDLGARQPQQSFVNRNVNARNKRDFEFNRSGNSMQTRPSYQGNSSGSMQTRPSYQGSSTGSRPVRAFDNSGTRNQGYQNAPRTMNQNSNVRSNMENTNSNTRTYTVPSNSPNSNYNRGQNQTYQTRPSYNTNTPNRAPVSNQNVQRQQVQRSPSVSTPRSAPAPAPARSESRGESRGSDSNKR